MYDQAERAFAACQKRGVTLALGIITNGLLLTEELVDRLLPYGLGYVKVTLDGDRDTHNRMRPLRGGQGTFDRIIENVRKVAGKVRIAVGGNFDADSVESYPGAARFPQGAGFRGQAGEGGVQADRPRAADAEKHHSSDGGHGQAAERHVHDGRRRRAARASATPASSSTSSCRTCAKRRRSAGSPRWTVSTWGRAKSTRRHAYTIGPDGATYACPGFTGEPTLATGHIDGRTESWRMSAAERFEHLAAWHKCGDCAFIPVCAGGCSVASHTELGDMNMPTCHKPAFESALVSLAHDAASAS